MSRSVVTRRSTRCNRSTSVAASLRSGRFGLRSNTPPRSWVTHRLRTLVRIPRSRAMFVTVAPGCLHSFPASRFNSSVLIYSFQAANRRGADLLDAIETSSRSKRSQFGLIAVAWHRRK